MSVFLILTVLGVLALAGFVLARQRAMALVGGDARRLHSRPHYYGWHGAIMAAVPALLFLVVWQIAQPMVIESRLAGMFPARSRSRW